MILYASQATSDEWEDVVTNILDCVVHCCLLASRDLCSLLQVSTACRTAVLGSRVHCGVITLPCRQDTLAHFHAWLQGKAFSVTELIVRHVHADSDAGLLYQGELCNWGCTELARVLLQVGSRLKSLDISSSLVFSVRVPMAESTQLTAALSTATALTSLRFENFKVGRGRFYAEHFHNPTAGSGWGEVVQNMLLLQNLAGSFNWPFGPLDSQQLGELTALTSLSINAIYTGTSHGGVLAALSGMCGKLSNLQKLDVSGSDNLAESVGNIFQAVAQLTKLTVLSFANLHARVLDQDLTLLRPLTGLVSLTFSEHYSRECGMHCHEHALKRLQADLPLLTSLSSVTPWVGDPPVWHRVPEYSELNIEVNAH